MLHSRMRFSDSVACPRNQKKHTAVGPARVSGVKLRHGFQVGLNKDFSRRFLTQATKDLSEHFIIDLFHEYFIIVQVIRNPFFEDKLLLPSVMIGCELSVS